MSRASTRLGNVSKPRRPTIFGKWTSKATLLPNQGRCHPLTVLDDHSRYSLGLEACSDEKTMTVRQRLISIFRALWLAQANADGQRFALGIGQATHLHPLTAWLIRQGIGIIHSRPFHPQTLGKDERFHRTFKAEIGQYCIGLSLDQCQRRFDAWRDVYNLQRPHEALDMQVPASRYKPSHGNIKKIRRPSTMAPMTRSEKYNKADGSVTKEKSIGTQSLLR